MARAKVLALIVLLMPLSVWAREDKTVPVESGELIESLCQLLNEHYVYPDIAERLCDTLRFHLERGRYRVDTYDSLSARLSRDLKSVNHDLHLNVWTLPPDTSARDAEEVDPIAIQLPAIRANAEKGFDFKKVEILNGNIGYLELTKFKSIPDPALERILDGAMNCVSSCSALILDLRRNTGGNDRMIREFMSYFFKKPVQLTGWYTRESGGVEELYTRSDFHNQRLVDLPLFVLVSSRTISGPEMVAYDFQVLKRATIVGERTRGAANPSRFHRIKEKLLVCIPYGYAVNPVTRTNWEGTGVTPDVVVPADSALSVAIGLAGEAAVRVNRKERDRVDSLIVDLKGRMRTVESLLPKDITAAENLFNETVETYYRMEYMNKYLLLDWLEKYAKAGNSSACEMIARQGISRYPEDTRFYSRLGDLYRKKGDYEKALQTYSSLLRLNPNDVRAKNEIRDINREIRNRTAAD